MSGNYHILSRWFGEAFASLESDAGYRLVNSMAERRGVLEWQHGARGFKDATLDSFLPPPLDASPLPFAGVPRFHDPPGFIARRVNPAWSPESENERKAWLAREEEAFEYVQRPFLSSEGKPELHALASLSALTASLETELQHRATRAARYTEQARRLLAIPMVEAEHHYKNNTLTGEADTFQSDLATIAWPSVREGDRLERVEHELRSPRFSDQLFPAEHWESQLKAAFAHLILREPELEIAEGIAARWAVCRRISRAAVNGEKVKRPSVPPAPSKAAVLGAAITQRWGVDFMSAARSFDTAHAFFEWGVAALLENDVALKQDYEAASLRRSLSRSGHWAPTKKGPSGQLHRDLEKLAERLYQELEGWLRSQE